MEPDGYYDPIREVRFVGGPEDGVILDRRSFSAVPDRHMEWLVIALQEDGTEHLYELTDDEYVWRGRIVK